MDYKAANRIDLTLFGYLLVVLWPLLSVVHAEKITLPNFQDLRSNYPGYFHHDGRYRNHELLQELKLQNTSNLLIHDTSALRLSYTLNQIDSIHSLGTEPIRFSKFGHDSVQGKDNMQYLFLPIAFGPYLADKYGYPNISKLHFTDALQTKHSFSGKQGILRVITYTNHENQPKGHVALWDCNHFHESKDWIAGHSLVTAEFWESPDSNCSVEDDSPVEFSAIPDRPVPASQSKEVSESSNQSKLFSILIDGDHMSSRTNALKHIVLPKHARHSLRKMRLKS